MMKIGSLTLIPMMLFGILSFSASSFSQDRSEQTQITRSDYVSMDKQVSILEFRVKGLEKNSDKIDALKADILSNKANIHFLNILSTGVYTLIIAIVALTSYFTYKNTEKQIAKQCAEWLKDNKEEILKSIETPTKSWLTENKDEVFLKLKDIQPIASISSVDIENIPDLNSATTAKNAEEREAVTLFQKLKNSHGIKKISTCLQLINKFKDSENENILILVADLYFYLGNILEGQEKINTYREFIELFKDSKNKSILITVAKASFNLGHILEGQEKIKTYREVIENFKDSKNENILEVVAKAYHGLGFSLEGKEQVDKYHELIKIFNNSKNENILKVVAYTYWNLALSLEGQEKSNTYSKLIEHFKNSNNEEILQLVARAYINLSIELTLTNQYSEAFQLLSEAIEIFKKSDNQDIKLQLANIEKLHNSLIQIHNSLIKNS